MFDQHLRRVDENADWTSGVTLWESLQGQEIVSFVVLGALNRGKELPPSIDDDDFHKRLFAELTHHAKERNAELDEDTGEARSDLRSRDFDQGHIDDVRRPAIDDLKGCGRFWTGEFETLATALLHAANEVQVYEREHRIDPDGVDAERRAIKISIMTGLIDAAIISVSFFSAGASGGMLGALATSIGLAAPTVMAGAMSGQANARAREAATRREASGHKATALAFLVAGASIAPMAALYRSGLVAVFQPTTYAVGIVSMGLLLVNTEAWQKARRDTRYKALLEKQAAAIYALEEAFESAPDRLDEIHGDALAALDDWLKEKEALWTEQGDDALDHVQTYIEEWRSDRKTDVAKANDALKHHWDEIIRGVDGHDITVPEHMRRMPDLSGGWLAENTITTETWRDVHARGRTAIETARRGVETAKSEVLTCHAEQVERIAQAEDAIREKLRTRLVRSGRAALPGGGA